MDAKQIIFLVGIVIAVGAFVKHRSKVLHARSRTPGSELHRPGRNKLAPAAVRIVHSSTLRHTSNLNPSVVQNSIPSVVSTNLQISNENTAGLNEMPVLFDKTRRMPLNQMQMAYAEGAKAACAANRCPECRGMVGFLRATGSISEVLSGSKCLR